MRQPGWEGSLEENGYMYMCGWVALLFTQNYHNIVNWLYSHTKSEKVIAPHSSTLAWKIPWMEEPGGLQSMGSWRVGHSWAISLSLFTVMHWRRKWQPTPVFLPGESRDGGAWWVPSLGSHRVRHDWSDLAAAAAAAVQNKKFKKELKLSVFIITKLLLHVEKYLRLIF